jgi:hypothetical protein
MERSALRYENGFEAKIVIKNKNKRSGGHWPP